MIAHALKILPVSLSKSTIASLVIFALLGITLIPFNAGTSFRFPEYYQMGFFLSILSVLVSIIIWLIAYCREPIRITWPDLGFFAFWLYAVIRWCFTPHVHWSQGTAIWLFATLPAYMGFRLWSGQIKIKDLRLVFSALAILLSGFALLQLYGVLESFNANFKMTGPFFNPAPLAGYLTILSPVIMYPILNPNGVAKWRTHLYWSALALILLVVIPSQSRAAWVAMIVSTGLLLCFRYRHFLTGLSRRAKSALIMALGILLVGGSLGIYNLKKDSADGRLLIWKVSTAMIAKNPVFGIGYGRFAAEYNLYQRDYFAAGKGSEQEKFLADNNSFAFNEYLKIAAELGIIGLALFLGWVGSFIIGVKGENYSQLGHIPLWGSLIAIACFAFFSYPGSVWGLNFMVLGILACMTGGYTQIINRIPRWTKQVLLVLVIFLAGGFGVLAQQSLIAANHWTQANKWYRMRHYEGARQEFLMAVNQLKYEGLFLQQAGKTMSLADNPKTGNDLLHLATRYRNDQVLHWTLGDNYTALGIYKQAEKWYTSAMYMVPNRLYPEYRLAKMYYENGDIEEFNRSARNVILRKGKNMTIAERQIKNELQMMLQN